MVAADCGTRGKSYVGERCARAGDFLDGESDPFAVLPDLPREEAADGNAGGGQLVGQLADERSFAGLTGLNSGFPGRSRS